jgi:hypothetical protein
MAKSRQDPALSFEHHSRAAKYEAQRSRWFRQFGRPEKAEEISKIQRHHEREAREAGRAMRRARA